MWTANFIKINELKHSLVWARPSIPRVGLEVYPELVEGLQVLAANDTQARRCGLSATIPRAGLLLATIVRDGGDTPGLKLALLQSFDVTGTSAKVYRDDKMYMRLCHSSMESCAMQIDSFQRGPRVEKFCILNTQSIRGTLFERNCSWWATHGEVQNSGQSYQSLIKS